jgi:hypothetical protein
MFDIPRNPDGSPRTRRDEENTPGIMEMLYSAGHGISDVLDGHWPGEGKGGRNDYRYQRPEPEEPAWQPPRNEDGSIRTRRDEEAEGGLTGMMYQAGHAVSDVFDWIF